MEDPAEFAKTMFNKDVLPDLYRSLHQGATFMELDLKAKKMTCSHVERRVMRGQFFGKYNAALNNSLEPFGPCGVSTRSGVKLVGGQEATGHQRDDPVPCCDGMNAFKPAKESRMFHC